MKRFLIFLFSVPVVFTSKAQDEDSTKVMDDTFYRAAAPHINDLIHTKLSVRFDYGKSYLYGKAWITLKPHFYPTDSLSLDAKGMDIHEISLSKSGQRTPLRYNYNGSTLHIRLDKTYRSSENYTIYIDYTAKLKRVKGFPGQRCHNGCTGFIFY